MQFEGAEKGFAVRPISLFLAEPSSLWSLLGDQRHVQLSDFIHVSENEASSP